MTYSYPGPVTYGPPNNLNYYEPMPPMKKSSAPATIAGVVIGGTTGAIIANRQNPNVGKGGEITDSFVKEAYEKYIAKSTAGKEAYNEGLEILKKIDSVSTPEELNALFSANKEAAAEICSEMKQTPEDFLKNITKDNLASNKNTIKEKIKVGNQTRYQDMKNQIQACWDKKAKKFVKKDHIKDDVFKAIEESCKSNWKNVLKYAGIGALVAGGCGFILSKLFTSK